MKQEILEMDSTDKAILGLLQKDATLPRSIIAEKVNLSTTPCWRRIQRLQDQGIIKGEVALLDKEKLNLGLTVFIAIRTNQHNAKWLDKFAKATEGIPEIVECYRMSGDIDYMLRVVVPDVKSHDQVYKRLIGKVDIYDVTSSFAMEELKYSTALPLDYA